MGGNRLNEDLFEEEQKLLNSALADLNDEQYRGNQLLPNYKLLIDHYHKLLMNTHKIFRISDRLGKGLRRQENEIQNLLDNSDQGFLTFGRDLKVDQPYSAECVRIFGRKITDMPITELLGQVGSNDNTLVELFQQAFSGSQDESQAILRKIPSVLRINDQDIRVECKLISQPLDDDDENSLIMMILTDITEKLQAEQQIHFLSYHDKLTALCNRAYVEKVLPDLELPENLPLSMVMVDMNALKLVNDVFGHDQGDRVLVAMAKALKRSCRQTDIVVRWGGDEFLILLPKTGQNECQRVCERIRNNCNEVVDSLIPLSAAFGTVTQDEGVAIFAEMFSIVENRMYDDKLKRSREVRQNIIASMEGMLHSRCFENLGHSVRTQQLTADFAVFLGLDLDAPEIKPISQLAVLHDIGKVAISKEILGKTGPLTPSEWEIVKNHSDIGYRMAQSIGEPLLADIILALHERWDGKGYPHGLKGEQIPLLARLFSIVDVYDVITHERPYFNALDETAALQEIQMGSGTQFDPELTERFGEFCHKKRMKIEK